ncbi:hypothetical protein AB0N24_22765 [Arthrobacter sp. NPDC093128]|jgi:hypothetical protein
MTAQPVHAAALGETSARELATKDRDALITMLDLHVEFRVLVVGG